MNKAMKCTVKHLPTDWRCPKCHGDDFRTLVIQSPDPDSADGCEELHAVDELECTWCKWTGYGSDIEDDGAEARWYVQGEDGTVHGPYEKYSAAEEVAHRIDGFIFSEQVILDGLFHSPQKVDKLSAKVRHRLNSWKKTLAILEDEIGTMSREDHKAYEKWLFLVGTTVGLAVTVIEDQLNVDVTVIEDQLNVEKELASPRELLPDWSCYAGTLPEVYETLNTWGVILIKEIRKEGSPAALELAMKGLRDAQRSYAKHGADDTEGREAIWELVKSACEGTERDPEKFWETYYS